MLHLSWCLEMKYLCLENTDNDTHKRNDVLWGDVILVQYKIKKTKKNCKKPLVICLGVQCKLSAFSAIIEHFRGSQSSKLSRGNSSFS